MFQMARPYYFLVAGKLVDEDGDIVFKDIKFESATQAENYLVENDLRGSVREEFHFGW